MEKDGVKLQMSKWFPKERQFWNCCKPPKKGYAGTAILISKESGLVPIKVSYDFNIAKHANEGRVTTAEFEQFILVAVYVPNSGVQGLDRLNYRVKEWDVDFNAYLKALEVKSNKPVILCGDLNVA